MDLEQAKYFDFIINNENYIRLLSNRLIKHTVNRIIDEITDLQKTLINATKE